MTAFRPTSRDISALAQAVQAWVREQGVETDSAQAARLAKNLGRLAPSSERAGLESATDASPVAPTTVALSTVAPTAVAPTAVSSTTTVAPTTGGSQPAAAPHTQLDPFPLPSTLVALRLAIARGEISIEDALARQGARLAQDAQWHAITHRFPIHTLASPDAPLAGVGLAHKDIFTMQGRPPRCGTAYVPQPHPPTSPVVAALEQAGSCTLAALAMPEFASGVTGQNADYPQPVNPVDPLAAVGGSSSGSAVAVAAGLCYGSLGTDTAGSVRIPAATCGVVGLMSTRDALSRTGCFPLAPGLDTVGVLARSALDVAHLFYAAMPASAAQQAFPEWCPLDRGSLLAQGDAVYDSLALASRPRLAWVTEHTDPRFSADAEQAQALSSFVTEWASDDASVRHERLHLQQALTCAANLMMHVEAAATHLDALRGFAPSLGSVASAVAMPGLALPAAWYAQSLQQRADLRKSFCDAHLKNADILLTPILPQGVPDGAVVHTDSPSFEPSALLSLFSWTAFVNYLGLPAIVFPIGSDARGRPISVQAIGRPHAEARLLAFAWHYERTHYGLGGVLPNPHRFQPRFPSVE